MTAINRESPTAPAASTAVRQVPLGEFADVDLQFRSECISKDHVREMIEFLAADAKPDLPPVVAYQTPVGLALSDGYHRRAAYTDAGRQTIPCEVRQGNLVDAELNSAASNLGHGLKRTNADKRQAVRRVLELQPTWSDRRIADHVGVSADLVGDVRPPATVDSDSCGGTARVGRDGKSRRRASARQSHQVEVPTPDAVIISTPPAVVATARLAQDADDGEQPEADDDGRPHGKGDSWEPDEEPPAGPKEVATPDGGAPRGRRESLRDRLGRLVPDHLTAVFGPRAGAIRAVAAQVKAAGVNTKKLDADKSYAPVLGAEMTGWLDEVEEARDRLLGQVPYCVCPACGGDGDNGACPTCYGSGHLTASQYMELPEHLVEEAGRHAPGDAFEPDPNDLPSQRPVKRPFVPAGPNLDANGRSIPARLRDAFAGDMFLAEAARRFRRLATQLKSASNWNAHIKPSVWLGAETAAHDVDDCRPYAVCGNCRGKGVGCQACLTCGFLPAGLKHELAREKKS